MTSGILGLLGATSLFGACHSRSDEASPEECTPVTAPLPATATTEGREGTYRLKLVATSGTKQGAVAEGTLWLQEQDSSLWYRTRLDGRLDSTTAHPLFGTAEIDLNSLDAVLVGSTMSRDPLQPGVLVIERRAASGKPPVSITMRLGSEANRQDQQRFDGGYTALRVQHVGPGRLAGSWSSGVTGERAAGYFCATRTGGPADRGE
jgi:hypothetical protein